MAASESASAAAGGHGVVRRYRRDEHNGGEEDHCIVRDRPLLDVLSEVHGFCLFGLSLRIAGVLHTVTKRLLDVATTILPCRKLHLRCGSSGRCVSNRAILKLQGRRNLLVSGKLEQSRLKSLRAVQSAGRSFRRGS